MLRSRHAGHEWVHQRPSNATLHPSPNKRFEEKQKTVVTHSGCFGNGVLILEPLDWSNQASAETHAIKYPELCLTGL